MRAVLFFAVVCLVLAAILETANSKPNAKKAKKGAVASPSKTKTATKAGPPTTSSKKSAAAKKPETAKAAIAKKSPSASNRPIWPISRLSNLSTKASEPKQRMLTLSDPSGDAVSASEPIIVGYSEDAEETSGSDMDFDEEDYGNEKADYNDFEADNDELVEEKPFNDYSGMGLEQNMSKSVMVN